MLLCVIVRAETSMAGKSSKCMALLNTMSRGDKWCALESMGHKAISASGSIFGKRSPCMSESLCNFKDAVFSTFPEDCGCDDHVVLGLSHTVHRCPTMTAVRCAPRSVDIKAGTTQDGNWNKQVFHQLKGLGALVQEWLHNMRKYTYKK